MSTFLRTAVVAALIAAGGQGHAALITFDDLVTGVTSYGYDGDGDNIADAVFSTTDPAGFNTVGPGPNQNYIREPGLEATSLLNPDLRVDFVFGAFGTLGFGFALNSTVADASFFGSMSVYDEFDNLLGSDTVAGQYTPTPAGLSSFPEGQVNVAFAGRAAYALLNFESQFGRFIIDDFSGTFGSTEVPEPVSIALVLAGLGLAGAAHRRRRAAPAAA